MNDITVSEFFSLVGKLRSNQRSWARLYKEGKVKTEECKAISREGKLLCEQLDAILSDANHSLAVSFASLIRSLEQEKGLKE